LRIQQRGEEKVDADDHGVHQQARTIPVVFGDVLLIRNGRESTPAEADLRRGDHLRRIED